MFASCCRGSKSMTRCKATIPRCCPPSSPSSARAPSCSRAWPGWLGLWSSPTACSTSSTGATSPIWRRRGPSARTLGKAPDRPLNGEADRACVLAALESVGLVTLFDEATPLELLRLVRPDLYVKGGDYDVERLAETALVRSWGGVAKAMPFVEGYSTSSLVARIRRC